MDIRLTLDETTYLARREGNGQITLFQDDAPSRHLQVIATPGGGLAIKTDTGFHPADAVRDGDTIWVRFEGRTYRFEVDRGTRRAGQKKTGDLSSPMPGQVQKVLVKPGDLVEAGQPLLVVEAMKMQLEIKAPEAGTVTSLLAGEGDQIDAGEPLAEVEPRT